LPQDPEIRRQIGLRNKANQVGLFNPERDKSKGGRKTAQIHRRRGTGVFNPRMGAFGLHKQWHINRGVENPKCEFCMAGISDFSEVK